MNFGGPRLFCYTLYDPFKIRKIFFLYIFLISALEINLQKKLTCFVFRVFQAAGGEWVLAAADSQSVGGGGLVGIGERGRIGCRGGRRRGRCAEQQHHVRVPGAQPASLVRGQHARGGELVLHSGTYNTWQTFRLGRKIILVINRVNESGFLCCVVVNYII